MRYTKTVLAAAIAGFASVATAQQGYQQQPPSAQQAPAEVGEPELRKFATAQDKVEKIGDKYNARMGEADGQEEMMEMQRSANIEMTEAVKNSGLSVQQYNQIARAVANDPELKDKMESM